MGRDTIWDDEKLKILNELATYGKALVLQNGNRKTIPWKQVIKDNPKLCKQLGNLSASSLSRAWNHYQFVAVGKCYFFKRCGNMRENGTIYCAECKERHNHNAKQYYKPVRKRKNK